MNLEEIKIQAVNYLEGPHEKGISFDDWADSKDFSYRDREEIWAWVEEFKGNPF